MSYNKGMPMGSRQLADKLGDYGIGSLDIRFPNKGPLKGYKRAQFDDAFNRYLAPSADNPSSATPRQINRDGGLASRIAHSAAIITLHQIGSAPLEM
jgi:hypothetical protein